MLPFAAMDFRTPASSDFLARRLAAIDWHGKVPRPRSRWWLVETCRAELAWATTEWRRLSGGFEERSYGPHPSEAWRLPHEEAAARVVNAHLHTHVHEWCIGELVHRNLPRQRRAALDNAQSAEYRLAWADAAARSVADLHNHLSRRRLAWRCFLAAGADYLRLRAAIDETGRLAA
jgi:hypothetical protein